MDKLFTALLLSSTLIIASADRLFHSTPDREIDMIHMFININVNIEEGSISGSVSHTFAPLSSDRKTISFDAERMSIQKVTMNHQSLKFHQEDKKVVIDLDKVYGWNDTITIKIDYSASPTLGFYFIRPDSSYPNKQLQAYTQGEDMDNHFWVPLHDYPNDKMTWDCQVTVDDPLKVISNGKLISTTRKGTKRTFHWKETIPNVSYLLAIAIGDYKKFEDNWEGIPVDYWVYQKYNHQDALRSFGKTPEMIGFFSDITGVRYPFEKYDQTIVEDFMWGGMENVTTTHQTDRTMHPEKVRPIHTSDGLVAHELAHMWYGDYLTTRNWPNIWLNEGFATYLELLWTEHDSDLEYAEYKRLKNLDATRWADKSYRRPTLQHYYYNSIELFDSNVYAKGSVILNMIRKYIGDDAFFRSLKTYTRINAAKNVETSDLKKALEETSGFNLDWFFKQWVYQPGIPDLTVNYRYSHRSKMVSITLKQTHDYNETSLFKLPMTVLIYNGEYHRYNIFFDKEEDTFTFPSKNKPLMVIVDEGSQIPKNLTFHKKIDELLYQLKNAPTANDRIWAARELRNTRSTNRIKKALIFALTFEPKWYVRTEVVTTYQQLKPIKGEVELMNLYQGQDDRVKRSIVQALKEYDSDKVSEFLIGVIENEQNDYIVSHALSSLIKVDLEKAKDKFDWAMDKESHNEIIRSTALRILSEKKTDDNLRKLKDLAVYGVSPYGLRPAIFRQIASYKEDNPELMNYFEKNIQDKSRNVRWVCANQIVKYGSPDQFALVLDMADKSPLRGRKISDIYDALDQRLAKAKKSKMRKEIKNTEKMRTMFIDYAEDWANK